MVSLLSMSSSLDAGSLALSSQTSCGIGPGGLRGRTSAKGASTRLGELAALEAASGDAGTGRSSHSTFSCEASAAISAASTAVAATAAAHSEGAAPRAAAVTAPGAALALAPPRAGPLRGRLRPVEEAGLCRRDAPGLHFTGEPFTAAGSCMTTAMQTTTGRRVLAATSPAGDAGACGEGGMDGAAGEASSSMSEANECGERQERGDSDPASIAAGVLEPRGVCSEMGVVVPASESSSSTWSRPRGSPSTSSNVPSSSWLDWAPVDRNSPSCSSASLPLPKSCTSIPAASWSSASSGSA
mmetsp:Transcript_46917/g.147117  ORF Transcript_46917/g.147117 Transcript_46917/m.147117 type:complete len:299 (-) Transcript_46917:44-940(-)